MAEALVPLDVLLNRANVCAVYMERELGFDRIDIWGHDFVRPFALWPHIEVWNRDFGGNPTLLKTTKGSPCKKYSPTDIALLEDPAKRQIYIEAQAGCIAPRYREVAAILESRSALMENPPPPYLESSTAPSRLT